MPYIILEDKKGFKKTHGWENYPTPFIRVAVAEQWPPNNPIDDGLIPAITTTALVFYRSKELDHDVWLYKEEP